MPESQKTNLTCSSRVQTALGQSLHNSLFHSHMKKNKGQDSLSSSDLQASKDRSLQHWYLCPCSRALQLPFSLGQQLSTHTDGLDKEARGTMLYILPNTHRAGDTQPVTEERAEGRGQADLLHAGRAQAAFHTPVQSSSL